MDWELEKSMNPKSLKCFFRGTEDQVGSGLGLYITKEAVSKMNGSITVSSEVNKGTTMIVRIPQAINEDSLRDDRKVV